MTSDTTRLHGRRGRLAITRREGESVEVGGATITVHEVKNGTVKLTIEAGSDITIMRTELTAGAEERPGSTGQGGC